MQLYDSESCPCKRLKCVRHAHCDVCRAHHKEKNALTACERAKAKDDKKAAKLARRESRRK